MFRQKTKIKNERETTILSMEIVNLISLLAVLSKFVTDITGIIYVINKSSLIEINCKQLFQNEEKLLIVLFHMLDSCHVFFRHLSCAYHSLI